MISLSVPGKTFLCGEYLALIGGPTILLATEPRFRMDIYKKSESGRRKDFVKKDFHPESPAGRLMKTSPEAFADYDFHFESQYGSGGFGASTAEYLCLSALKQMGVGLWTEHQLDLDVREALTEYRALHADQKVVPSGADMVAQACGWVTGFERQRGRIQIFKWPFRSIGFLLFKTGNKVPTHEHLKTLNLEKLEVLQAPAEKIQSAFTSVSESQLLTGLNELTAELERLGLQGEETRRYRRELWAIPGVRAVKGCGAMGADVILLAFDRREAEMARIFGKAQELGLTVVANENALSPGIQKDLRFPNEKDL